MMRDQWWWLGSSDSCEFCVGTDMIMAVSRRICSCIYLQRRIYVNLYCYMLIYATAYIRREGYMLIYAASIGSSDAGSDNIRDPTLSAQSIMWGEETVNLLHRKPGRQSTLTIAVNTLDRTQPVFTVLHCVDCSGLIITDGRMSSRAIQNQGSKCKSNNTTLSCKVFFSKCNSVSASTEMGLKTLQYL